MKLKMTYGRKISILLTVFWMAIIFLMSSAGKEDSNAQSGAVCRWICDTFVEGYEEMPIARQRELEESISFPVRKGAHMTEYAILGGLLLLSSESVLFAVPVGVLYAVTDEIHQIFVPGRAGQARDVLIDSAGLVIGVLIIHIVLRTGIRSK